MKPSNNAMWVRATARLKRRSRLLVDTLRPIHERYNDLIDSPELDRILDEGAVKAREKASKTYRDVELAMGLHRK